MGAARRRRGNRRGPDPILRRRKVTAMVEAQERAAEAGQESCWYNPGRVLYWLSHWQELRELAVPTTPAIRYDKLAAQVPGGYRRPGSFKYAETMVDIERAWRKVAGWWVLARLMGEWCMAGWDLVSMADRLRVSVKEADRALGDICEAVALELGWRG